MRAQRDSVEEGWPAESDHNLGSRLDSRALVRGEKRALLAIVALTALGTLAEAGFLVLLARAGVSLANGADMVVLQTDRSITMPVALGAAAALVAIRFGANVAAVGLSSASMARATIRLRRAFTQAFLGTAWDLKHGLAPGRVQQLLSNYSRTAVNVVAATARGATALISLATLVSVALVIQPYITLVATLLVALLSVAMLPLRRLVKRKSRQAADAQVAFGVRANELESLAMEIDVHGVRTAAAKRVNDDAAAAANALRWSQFAQLAIGPTYQFVAYGGILALLIVGAVVGVDDIGTVGAVMVLLLRCLAYGQSLQVASAQHTQGNVYATSLADEIDRYAHAATAPGQQIPVSPSSIQARNLNFAYGDEPTLSDLDFTIDTGARVAVVGPSGSGKSTLTQLLLGLRSAPGSLTLAGVPIEDADTDWFKNEVALVPQHSNLISGTVADNVRFLRPQITDADIEAACKKAAIHDEIVALGGYSASVGERGGELSGGQQQRLCIARALAGSPGLLVLDEATSALDAQSERKVLSALSTLGDDITIVAITHRPAVLDLCDQVLHLDEGRVSYFGPTRDYDLADRGLS